MELPSADDRAGMFMAFDGAGNPFAAAGTVDLPVSAFMETVLDDTSASAALTTLGFSTFFKTLVNEASAATLLNALGVGPFAQCRLTLSGGNLLLSRHNGRMLTINGVGCEIPGAGVLLAAPATTNTTYNIYAYMDAGAMTLEASATAHATDATTGVEIKSGDATRTLVGMARTVSSAWVDTAARRFVLSYFNRRNLDCLNVFAANRTTTSSSVVELSSSERAEFLAWADEAPLIGASGYGNSSGGAAAILTFGVGVDGTSLLDGLFTSINEPVTAYNQNLSVPALPKPVAEGYHYATLLGGTSAGTATYVGSATAGQRCAVAVAVRG